MKKPVFTGACVAIITPFKTTGEINYDEFKKIIDHQISHGTDAITIMGTTGESSAIPDKEHREAIAFGCEYINGRVPVIAGAGSNDTAYAVDMTKHAASCGADAVLSVTPYYNKTTQRGLVQHFNAIADASDCPVILYNVPSRTGMGITADTYAALSKHPNINGVKEASGNFSLIAEAMALCGGELMAMGGLGVISVLSNVCPQETHDLTALCFAGKYQEAMAMQLKYLELINALFCEVNPIPVKKAMELLGWQVGALRLPLYEMGAANADRLKKAMDAVNCAI